MAPGTLRGVSSPASSAFAVAAALEGVPSAFVATRDGIDTLLRDRGLRRSTPEDTAESLLRGAAATARLEGSDADVETLRAGGGDATARGAVLLSTELLGLAGPWRTAPLQALARMHALAATGTLPADERGRPATPDGARRLTWLAQAVQASAEVPGLVVAALVHAEIAAAGAFATHNRVVARAAERLVLVVRGVDPASLVVTEAGHAAEPDGYASALAAYERDAASLHAGDPGPGVHQWLLYATQAFARGAEASPVAR